MGQFVKCDAEGCQNVGQGTYPPDSWFSVGAKRYWWLSPDVEGYLLCSAACLAAWGFQHEEKVRTAWVSYVEQHRERTQQ